MSRTQFKLEHIEQLSGSPAHFPAVKAWVEIIEAGHGDGNALPIGWDDQVAVMRYDGKIVGLIVWKYMKWTREAWICIGWVDVAHRRKGIYMKLYTAVKKQAISQGARFLSGGVKPDNWAIRAAAESQGRSECSIVLREEIG